LGSHVLISRFSGVGAKNRLFGGLENGVRISVPSPSAQVKAAAAAAA